MLSIIMPTFNAEKYIDETLYSIKNQNFIDYELVVCDKYSTDDTLNIIKNYGINNLKIINVGEAGVPAALNMGFNIASGDYFCWLNADDVFANNRVLEVINTCLMINKSDVLLGDFYKINEFGRIIDCHLYSRKLIDYRLTNIFTGALFFSKKIWTDFVGFSVKYKYSFEYELINFIYTNKYTVSEVKRPLSCLRIHIDTLTNINSIAMNEEAQKIQNSMNKFIKKSYLDKFICYGPFRSIHNMVCKFYFKLFEKNWVDVYWK